MRFEARLGGRFEQKLPAASSVGSHGDRLDVIFVAGEAAPRHLENPEQVPAYHYPAEHGPRAPSFARATVASDGARKVTFISGMEMLCDPSRVMIIFLSTCQISEEVSFFIPYFSFTCLPAPVQPPILHCHLH